jgi:hypothetical protein
MPRYVEGSARDQVTLLPECLDDYIAHDNPIRVIEAFVEELNLEALGFKGNDASGNRPALLSPGGAAEDLRLRVSESDSVEPAT